MFEQSLRALGWTVGQDLKIDYRMAGGADIRQYAAELAALAPDLIMPVGSATVAPVQQAAPTIPIVMVNVADPVGAGFVQSLARPGGNTTGFTNFEYSLGGKWVELLKQIAPHVTQAVVLRDPTTAAGIGQFAAIQSVAQSLTVELTPVGVRDLGEIERTFAAFARTAKGSMIVTVGSGVAVHRKLLSALRRATSCPLSTLTAITPRTAAWSPTGLIRTICSGAPPATSTASSRVKSRPTCRCRHQRNTS